MFKKQQLEFLIFCLIFISSCSDQLKSLIVETPKQEIETNEFSLPENENHEIWKMRIKDGELSSDSCLYSKVEYHQNGNRSVYEYECGINYLLREYHYTKNNVLYKKLDWKREKKIRYWIATLDSLENITKVDLSSGIKDFRSVEYHQHFFQDSLKIRSDIYDFSKTIIIESVSFSYDEKKRLTKIITIDGFSKNKTEQTFEYDENGNLSHTYQSSGKINKKYLYNENNLLIEQEEWVDGRKHQLTRIIYDSKYRITKKIFYSFPKGQKYPSYLFKYKYL